MKQALVVDDSRAMRSILGKILSACAFNVFPACNGVEALKVLRELPDVVALVCVDYNMPEMNGIELIRVLRTLPGYKDVPVMMVTTETHLASMKRAFDVGASEYVMKPFTPEMIVDKLRILGMATAN